MIRSRSSVLRSMPIYHAQLNRTAFRSFAPGAGVYTGARFRAPRRAACSGPAGAEPVACANAEDGSLTVSAIAIATLAPKIFRRTVMMAPSPLSVVRVTGGDLNRAPVRHD